MSARGRASTLLGLTLLAVGCTSAPAISTKGYSQSCKIADDCFPVPEGAVSCCGAGCPSAAIRQDQVSKYTTELALRISDACSDLAEIPSCPDPVCPHIPATCEGGVCRLAAGSPDGGMK